MADPGLGAAMAGLLRRLAAPQHARLSHPGSQLARNRIRSRWALPTLLLVGLLIRLALAPFGRFGYDSGMMRNWSWHLIRDPLPTFYERAANPDHLPGDLWLLLVLSRAYDAVASRTGTVDLDSTAYLVMLKSVPAAADVVIGFMLYRIIRRLRGERDGLLAAAAYLLNPASIFLTSTWGQWDAVSAALVLIALWQVLGNHWVRAMPVLAWAVLIKPPLALLLPLLLIKPIREALPPRTQWSAATRGALAALGGQLAAAALLFLAVLLAVCLPFNVGLPSLPTRWTLFERLQISLDLYPATSVGALNIWSLTADSGNRPDDTAVRILGLTAQVWGMVLLGVVYVAVLIGCWRGWRTHGPLLALIWGPLATCFALYMLPTRVHERYFFPALVFALLLVGVQPRCRWLAVLISITYLANLVSTYNQFEHALSGAVAAALGSAAFARAVALANMALLGYVLLLPWRSWSVARREDRAVPVPFMQQTRTSVRPKRQAASRTTVP